MSLRDAFDVTFGLVFPLLMVALPAACAAFVRFREEGAPEEEVEARRRQAGRLSIGLWAATAVSAAVVVGLWTAGLGAYGRFAWGLFFPLWFGLAWPLTAVKNPSWGPRPTPPARGARLTPRRDPPPAPVWTFYASCAAFLALATAAEVFSRGTHPAAWVAWLALPAGGIVWLAVAAYALWGRMRESEPLPPHPAPELERAYDAFRLWLRRCFYWFGIAGGATFAAAGLFAALALAGYWPAWAGGVIGGLAGSLLGITGGVVGTIGTKKRVELHQIYRDALASPPMAGAV
jgi:hypothetical protein